MKHEIDLKNYPVRTDLISEVLEKEKDGFKKDIREENGVKIETITLEKEVLEKKKGIYKTLYFDDVTDEANAKKVRIVLEKELKDLLKQEKIKDQASCMVLGLGNKKATADALGPFVIDQITVTRHLFTLDLDVDKKYRSVSSFSPGVMGTTGMETQNIILGILEKEKVDFILVVDALCSSSLDRLNKTIQITNTGIHPGSGIGNNRRELSKESLGIPVIAIGVPTVVEASTIVSNTFSYLFDHIAYEKDNSSNFSLKFVSTLSRDYKDYKEHLSMDEKRRLLGLIGTLAEDEKKAFLQEVLIPLGYNYIVSPKEIDYVMEKLSHVISHAINCSLSL